jgi:hypothetical protein
MSDDQVRQWFEQFRDSPAGPMRMPSAHEIRRRAWVWLAIRLGGVVAVAVVVCAVPLMAGQPGGGRAPAAIGDASTSSRPPIRTTPHTSTPPPSASEPTTPPVTAPPEPAPPSTSPPSPTVISQVSDTFQIQPTSIRAGQTVTLSGRGCTVPGVRASRLLVQVDVSSPDGNDRVARLEYPVRADGSWQGKWQILQLPGRIGYGPGFQLRPSCVIVSYRAGSKYTQGVFSYDVERLTIQPPA